jgi:hypothetical protein
VQVQVQRSRSSPGPGTFRVGMLCLAKYKCLLPIRDAPGKLEEEDD